MSLFHRRASIPSSCLFFPLILLIRKKLFFCPQDWHLALYVYFFCFEVGNGGDVFQPHAAVGAATLPTAPGGGGGGGIGGGSSDLADVPRPPAPAGATPAAVAAEPSATATSPIPLQR